MMKRTTKERLKAVQRRLGVEADGILGPMTLSRIETLLDQALPPIETEPQYSLVVSKKGIQQMIQFEISSERYYKKRLSHPYWPGGGSGITIGIGYDLGYVPKSQFRKDWKGVISDIALEALINVSRLRASKAQEALASVEDIKIPFDVAKEVFYTATLPKYAKMTEKAYPGVKELPADCQAALLSLVYNRGIRMSGIRRKEMKALQPLVVSKDLNGIASQIRLMKRLWDKKKLKGLHIRRNKEALLITKARSDYDPSELMMV